MLGDAVVIPPTEWTPTWSASVAGTVTVSNVNTRYSRINNIIHCTIIFNLVAIPAASKLYCTLWPNLAGTTTIGTPYGGVGTGANLGGVHKAVLVISKSYTNGADPEPYLQFVNADGTTLTTGYYYTCNISLEVNT